MRCFTEVKILKEGGNHCSAKKFRFSSSVNSLLTLLEISTNENEVTTIIADSSKFKLHGNSKNEFPSLPDMTGATHFKIPQTTLKDMFYRTSFAVSREDNRYALTGVLMKIENKTATFVGTDGKRLSSHCCLLKWMLHLSETTSSLSKRSKRSSKIWKRKAMPSCSS